MHVWCPETVIMGVYGDIVGGTCCRRMYCGEDTGKYYREAEIRRKIIENE